MDINLLVKLTSRAWSMQILALMHRGTPGRQAPLLAASGAGRTAFAQSLSHLVDLKLLERNPGHGHPLRPEFRLMEQGIVAAEIADKISDIVQQPSGQILLRRSWTIPILVASRDPIYFTDVKKQLGSITDRALSKSMIQLQDQQWLRRDIDTSSRPLRPLYQATDIGAQISQAVYQTAR